MSSDTDEGVEQKTDRANSTDRDHIAPPPGRDLTHLMHSPPRVQKTSQARPAPAVTSAPAKEVSQTPTASVARPKLRNKPGASSEPEGAIPRLNLASTKADRLEVSCHVRRRPWEAGNVHAPLVLTKPPTDGTPHPVKALWQSDAEIRDKIVRPGPFSVALHWPAGDDGIVHPDAGTEPPVYPLFYTEEGYVYLPKEIHFVDKRIAIVKYVEFWGWTYEPTSSPSRELVYKTNMKTGLHARKSLEDAEHHNSEENLEVDWSNSFQEEVQILELLNMTGSSHFVKMVGFPLHSDSGFFTKCDEWTGSGDARQHQLLGSNKFSTYSLWKLFQCLAKACAVMTWGSEYPDFPVKRWDQIVHLDLGQSNVMISSDPDYGHTCGGSTCFKIAGFSAAIRLPASDIVNKPWEELDKPGAAKRYRATEVKAELALNQHHYKASGGYAPERVQDLTESSDDFSKDKGKDKEMGGAGIKGSYGWWTNVWAIGNIVKGIYQNSFEKPAAKKRKLVFKEGKVVPDPELGVTDEASLRALTHLEQEAYWRRHVSGNSIARLERVIAACTAENPRDRITIPALLLEITKGLSEAHDPSGEEAAPPLHWEADGQKLLIAHTHDRIRKLATSNLYSRRDIGLRLHANVYAEMQGLLKGQDSPVSLGEPMKFQIRPHDRQKWDEVVRRVFGNGEGKLMAEKHPG